MIGRGVSSENVCDCLWISKDEHLGPEADRNLICGSIRLLPVAVHCTEVSCVEKVLADSENEAFAGWASELCRARATMGSTSVEPDNDEQGNAGRYCYFHIWVCNNDSKGVVDGGEVKHWRSQSWSNARNAHLAPYEDPPPSSYHRGVGSKFGQGQGDNRRLDRSPAVVCRSCAAGLELVRSDLHQVYRLPTPPTPFGGGRNKLLIEAQPSMSKMASISTYRQYNTICIPRR